MYKCVFLDLDDTVWDFHSNSHLSLADVFVMLNLDKYFSNFDAFFEIYCKKNTELWEDYGRGKITQEFLMIERFRYPLSLMGVNDLKLAARMSDEYLAILPTKKTLMPDCIEVLEYLYAKYPLTIVSNGFTEVQYKKLRSADIEHYFRHIVLSENAGALKPNPQIFEYALSLNNAQASEAIMIGDSYQSDILGANNAGIDAIYYPLTYPDNPAEYSKSKHIIKSLKEIMRII